MKSFSPARLVGYLLNGLAAIAPKLAGRLSFYLFGLPKRKKAKEQETDFLATGKLRFEAIQGQEIATYHWGDSGPVALLAHGWESHAGRWRKLVPELLKAGFQVVAVDAPAHGRSSGRHFTMIKYAEVLKVMLQQHGPVDTLVGHSVGGASSIWAMGSVPAAQRPRQAVILAAFSELQTIMDNAQRLIGASATLMTAIDDHIERVTGARIPDYSMSRMAKSLGAVSALLIHDRKDRVTAFSESERLHAAWPGSRLLVTKGMGHGLTAPFVFEAVLEFVGASTVQHPSSNG